MFIHPQSLVEQGSFIGAGTRIWAFAHILPNARIGDDCNICDNVFIEGDVSVGDRVTIKCGVQLWNGIRVGNDVFIGPNATFTNDRFPRSKKHLGEHPVTRLEDGCSIGANATILPGIVIGHKAMVGAGAVVTKSVPPFAIVAGNPAEIIGYVTEETKSIPVPRTEAPAAVDRVGVGAVRFHRMPLIQDMRGDLSVGEFSRTLPFDARRYFIVFNVKSREVRGEHAHKKCKQFLICVAGSCRVLVDDGVKREVAILDNPTLGLYIPPMIWGVQYKYTSDAVLLVFASDYYDPADYIRDYRDFCEAVNRKDPKPK